MVRKALVALSLLAIGSHAIAQEKSADPLDFVIWEFESVSGSVFWVNAKDLTYENDNKTITAWVRGNHYSDKTVNYRSSMTRMTLNCSGSIRTSAFTAYAANGRATQSWNGYGSDTYIRPETMSADLEQKLCGKK